LTFHHIDLLIHSYIWHKTKKMVHLSSIPSRPLVGDKGKPSKDKGKRHHDDYGDQGRDTLGTCEFADGFTTSVYGSRFAAQALPKHEMPEGEMPCEVAYRLIKDDLSLDGNPRLKCVFPFYFNFFLSSFLLPLN
jgi:hypothetical protein